MVEFYTRPLAVVGISRTEFFNLGTAPDGVDGKSGYRTCETRQTPCRERFRGVYVVQGHRHGYSSRDLTRSATSHEGCSVRQLRSGALDWPSDWTGNCNWFAFYGFRRVAGSPVVSRARGSRWSHLRVPFVASSTEEDC